MRKFQRNRCAVLFLAAGCCAFSAFASSQTDIPGPAGSGQFGKSVTVLPNGNFVVTDPNYSIPAGAANVGAVYLYDGATLSVISTLTGSTAGDHVGGGSGSGDGITVLTNGNFVVRSQFWQNGGATTAGAVTWGSATTGVSGTVSASNSLIGGTANDELGSSTVVALTNGHYVVLSPNWTDPSGPTASAGAATWCNGNGGTVGLVTSSNSLVGGTLNDQVGLGYATELTNGNYVVASYQWNDPTGPTAKVGAASWCNGSGGTVGLITSGNSLIGGTANDQVGNGGLIALTNGNYVVRSDNWNNPTGPVSSVGAVTWSNGNGSTVGLVTSGNSLVGGTANDGIGNHGVVALKNGNYAVASPNWTNPTGPISKVGAATWGNGTGGTVGLVTPTNSLVGGTTNDQVGNFGAYVLSNGNYVVDSDLWTNPTGPIAAVGAVTWCNGAGGTVGLVTPTNSLVGGTANDKIGSDDLEVLTNGNYVVESSNWTNPAGSISKVGAVTWGNGSGGTVGLVTPSNSLVGGTANDRVPYFVKPLTNGNYVVDSYFWSNPTGPVAAVGAVTWCNGAGGTVGLITPSNSLVGGTANDNVGGYDVAALANGNYVVSSQLWNNPTGPVAGVGAATWGNGNGGTVGLVTPGNSLVGGTANDGVSSGGVRPLTNGHYIVVNQLWDNPAGPITDAGAVTFSLGNGSTVGAITSANSVRGTVTNGVPTSPTGFSFDYVRNRLFVGRANSNIVTIFVPSIAHHLKVAAAANATIGTTTQVVVTVQDIGNATVANYTGTVHFTSTDGAAGLPSDYTFVASDNGVHTFNVTLNTLGTFIVTATDTFMASITGTSNSIQVNPPLVFSSSAGAVPNPAGLGQSVTFSASATGGAGALTYSWNFGDTSTATGASVTHAYMAAGVYPAVVTVTDSTNATASSTVMVTVNAPLVGTGLDSDGDGFSDSFELAVGSDPDNAASTPTGQPAAAGAGVQTLTISKASIKLNFAKPSGADSISFSGTIAVPAGFKPAGEKTFFSVGTVYKALALTAKGSASSGKDSVKISLKLKNGAVLSALSAKYTVTFKNGSFASALAADGLTNNDAKATSVMVPFTFIFNDVIYQKTQTMSYTAKKGKSGSAK